MSIDHKTVIVFTIKKITYSGELVYQAGRNIRIKFHCRTLFKIDFNESIALGEISGSITEPTNNIKLFNCTLYSNGFASNGIARYEIISTYAVIGNNLRDIDLASIKKFVISFNKAEDWIGNHLISISTGDIHQEFSYNVKMHQEKKFKIDEWRSLDIINNATVPIGIQENVRYTIVQNTSFVFNSKTGFNLENMIDLAHVMQDIISFSMQARVGLTELCFFKKRKYGNEFRDQKIYILLSISKEKYGVFKLHRQLINFFQFYDNAGIYFLEWEKLENNNNYIRMYFKSYYYNDFVDQKLVMNINLLESMHNAYFDSSKRSKEEYKSYLKIISECLPEKYRDEIIGILSDKNSLSLRSKLYNYCSYAKNEPQYKEDIGKIVRFRNISAHGAGFNEFTIDEIVRFESETYSIICNLLKTKIFSAK
jgi:hypothetical protein